MNEEEQLREGIKSLGLVVTDEQIRKLLHFADLVREGNRWVHLVSRRDLRRIVSKHILESLQIVPYLPEGASCADIGSGAGFPGIPVKIIRPDIKMTLYERKKKKALFLIEMIKTLELSGIRVEAQSFPHQQDMIDYLLIRNIDDRRMIKSLSNLGYFLIAKQHTCQLWKKTPLLRSESLFPLIGQHTS
ncbi:16S rRNA (guanine(527)-N(7))-methyltransferase RsmG [candidate division WOR-3 bacterium]|uniref:Ribosomal RNA small subunit methyltransferase G n=1 Tax=candidate division WOR-3 bacterium TaxID=2052148 RepID=A0A660SI34_UNCW3|nr:MAG: 16S rRNA (guanine(527)-N(7))-methyltransferase RsmG [candidate division WOR-3 bacterium]